MEIPSGSFAVAALVVFAIPGLIYAAIRRRFLGEDASDRDPALSIARGIVFATLLTTVYLLIFGDRLFAGLAYAPGDDGISVTNARGVAATVLVLYFLVPAAIATALRWREIRWRRPKSPALRWMRIPRTRYGYKSVATAWDHAIRDNKDAWVKIRRADGHWVGGWVTQGSASTPFPESPSIYIDHQFTMSSEGKFVSPIDDTGVWVLLSDTDVVSWTRPHKDEQRRTGPAARTDEP